MKERRYDVDWLRVVATLAIFLFHCARFFDTEGWELKNVEQSFIIDVLRGGLVWPWVMELFFLLSGVGSWYALKSRSGGQYLFERVKRLLIPLYTVGFFLLLPPQFYFHLVTNEGFTGTFWEAIPRYLDRFGGFFSNLGRLFLRDPALVFFVPFTGHLWFLQYLFLISLAALPLLLYLKSEGGQRLIERLAGWCDRRGGAFLFVIPIALALIALRYRFPGDPTWADFVYYTIFFLAVPFRDETKKEPIESVRRLIIIASRVAVSPGSRFLGGTKCKAQMELHDQTAPATSQPASTISTGCA